MITCNNDTLTSQSRIRHFSLFLQSSFPTTSSSARSRPARRGGCSSSSSRAPRGRCSFGCRSRRRTRTRTTARRSTTISITRLPRVQAAEVPARGAAGAVLAVEDQVYIQSEYIFSLFWLVKVVFPFICESRGNLTFNLFFQAAGCSTSATWATLSCSRCSTT